MAKVGRPTDYTPELASEFCFEIFKGNSFRKICQSDKFPEAGTIFDWFRKYPDFQQQYALAKQESSDAAMEKLDDLGDEAIKLAQEVDPKASGAVVQAYKLKADNMKWAMSKLKPKKYGDKLDMTTNGKDLPTPLLQVIKANDAVLNNNSDPKAGEDDETD